MKITKINYDLFSDKVKKDERVVLISDAHDKLTDRKFSSQLIKGINDLKPHHVAIAGDTMQGVKYNNPEKCRDLAYTLEGLAEAQPVVMSLGNHDLVGLTEEGRRNYRGLGANSGNVYPLDNQSVVLGDFRVTGFSTEREAYAPSNHKSGKANELFVQDWNSSGIILPKENSPYFEELVGHAPHPLASREVLENALGIKNFNMYLTGHLHDGYMPAWLRPKLVSRVKDKGIWEMPVETDKDGKVKFVRPWVYTKTNLCRGVHYIGSEPIASRYEDGRIYLNDGTEITEEQFAEIIRRQQKEPVPLVISGGINKFFGLPASPEVTVIDIHPSEKGRSK